MTKADDVARGILAVFEAAQPNSAQRAAINQVRVLLGDVPAPGCLHDAAGNFRDEDDVLRCVLCNAALEGAPVNTLPPSANETPVQDE